VEAHAAAVGRPRDSRLDARIRAAALAVLHARGPAGVTVEAIAEEARCGKTSIYRRYRNSSEILAAALEGLAQPTVLVTQRLERREHLVLALEQFRKGVEEQVGLRAAVSLMYDPDSEFAHLMRRHLLGPRLQAVAEIIRSAKQVGEVPAAIEPESLLFALAGSYFTRLAVAGIVEPNWAGKLVDQLWRSWQ
jgi:AcrR family transcriptional regulator